MNEPSREDYEVLNQEHGALEQAHRRLQQQHAVLYGQSRRRVGTGLVAAFTVLGIGLGVVLGYLVYERTHRPAEPAGGGTAAADPASISAGAQPRALQPKPKNYRPARLSTVPPVLANGSAAAPTDTLQAELDQARHARELDQERIRSLTGQLVERERELLAAQQTPAQLLASAGTEDLATAGADSAGASPAAPDAAAAEPQPDTWLPVLNGLLDFDGYRHLRFEAGTRVEGQPELSDVTVLEWDENGLVDAVLKARRVRFELHRMTQTLVARFYEGHRTSGGLRVPLPPEGARLDFPGVNVDAWLEHFPELTADAGEEPTPEQRRVAETARQALDQRLSLQGAHGYYHLAELGELEGHQLRYVQLQWYDAQGVLLKTFEADSLQILLHDNGTVELVLRNGAILEGALRRPFSGDQFRLYLTQQPLDEWRQCGAPVVEAGP